jgi:hypothetical protein
LPSTETTQCITHMAHARDLMTVVGLLCLLDLVALLE